MISKTRHIVMLAIATTAMAATHASAQHTGDVWIGVDSNGQLAASAGAFVPADNYAYLVPVSGLLHGWSDDAPGFDHVVTPADGLAPMQSGANIWLEVVELDPAFRVIDDAFQILDAPGDDTQLGDHTLHQHDTWHINSSDAAYDPDRCVWHATFVLRDDGSTGYATSDPLTFNFTNVPVRPEGTPADGDFDLDMDVDWDDYRAFAVCLFGPAELPQPDEPAVTTCEVECLNAFDFDDDRDVDLQDFAAFQTVFSN